MLEVTGRLDFIAESRNEAECSQVLDAVKGPMRWFFFLVLFFFLIFNDHGMTFSVI